MSSSDHLLNTNVTWGMVESVLQKTLGTTAKFGSHKNVVSFAEGQGFMAKMALTTLDWHDETVDLPQKVVVKIVSADQVKDLGKGLFGDNWEKFVEISKDLHNAEVSFYEHIGARDILVTFYGGYTFSGDNKEAGFLIMEYVPDCLLQSVYHQISDKNAEKVIREVAKIAAESVKNPHKFEEIGKNAEVITSMRELFITPQNIVNTMPVLVKNCPDLATEAGIYLSKVNELLEIETYKKLAHFDGNGVLCHGDLWAGNVLWKESNGELEAIKILDFQATEIGSPVGDLFKLFTLNLTPEVRVEKTEYYLKYYCDILQRELDGRKVPFTYEQLLENYEKQYPILIAFHIGFFPGMIQTFTKNCDEKEAQRRLDILKNMFRGMLKTAVQYIGKHYPN